jgi:hypothetical protein
MLNRSSHRHRARRRRGRGAGCGGRRRGLCRGLRALLAVSGGGIRRITSADYFQLFQHVVEAGQRQVVVRGEDALAVGVDLFGEVADAGLLFGRGDGKGEGFEAAGFVVARSLPTPSQPPCCQRPDDMHAAGQDAEEIRIVERDGDQHIVWRYRGIEELKRAMLGGFHRWRCSAAGRPALRASPGAARQTSTSCRGSALARLLWSRSGFTRSSTHW